LQKIASTVGQAPSVQQVAGSSARARESALQCLRLLAHVCDGAGKKDDIGFNKTDSAFGHSLAAANSLSDKQHFYAQRMLAKYKRQLPPDLLQAALSKASKEYTVGLMKSKVGLFFSLEKAKPFPDGTIRSWNGKKYKKVSGVWEHATEGKAKSEAASDEKLDEKKKTPEKLPLKGSKELHAVLEMVGKKKVFLDDVSKKDKKHFNSATKSGLIVWRHVVNDEYVATLTEAGKKAGDAVHGLKAKVKRESRFSFFDKE
jgi:hypothetical protein